MSYGQVFCSGICHGTKKVIHLNCLEITKKEISKIPRTTGNAEQRMGVLKNIQLGTRKINRIDDFVSMLEKDMIGIQRNYDDKSTRKSGRRKSQDRKRAHGNENEGNFQSSNHRRSISGKIESDDRRRMEQKGGSQEGWCFPEGTKEKSARTCKDTQR